MAPSPYSDELWGLQTMPKYIDVTVLMPNGTMISLSCHREATLQSIKSEVWKLARKDALYRLLLSAETYIFSAVNQDGKLAEYYDEQKRLCDLRLFITLLKVIEPKGNKEEKVLHSKISIAIGKSLDEFDRTNDSEALEFRSQMLNLVKEIVDYRNTSQDDEKLLYYYPPELDDYLYLIQQREIEKLNKDLRRSSLNSSPKSDCNRRDQEDAHTNNYCNALHERDLYLKKNRIQVFIWKWNAKTTGMSQEHVRVEVSNMLRPSELIYKLLTSATKSTSAVVSSTAQFEYLLKVCSIDQYLLGEQPLLRYKYIVDCMTKDIEPHLMLICKADVIEKMPRSSYFVSTFLRKQHTNTAEQSAAIYQKIKQRKLTFLWQANGHFQVTITSATYLNITDVEKIYVKAGLYHGNEPLCKQTCTKEVDPVSPVWREQLTFDLNMEDIPRNARLCLSVCAIKKKTKTQFAISWGNTQVFDYYGRLLSGRVTINLLPMPKNNEDLLHPLGMNNSRLVQASSSLGVEFDRRYASIIYPSKEEVLTYGRFAHELESRQQSYGHHQENKLRHLPGREISTDDRQRLVALLQKDQLSPISAEDCDFIWRWRLDCVKIPDSLPKLIDSVNWSNRDEVSQLYLLLESWQTVRAETALELLDCKYPDIFVRNHAVNWLGQCLTDEQLYQYLLQLVQVLKYEPYFDNFLTRFLIRKSLLNRKIGHYFFWHIKSEMNEPVYVLRFGLILEGYCRGIGGDLLEETVKQVEALDKLSKLTDKFKASRCDTQKKKARYLSEQLQQEDYVDALRHFRNPLDNAIVFGELQIDRCQIMDSAKKPLWLVWNNPDPLAHLGKTDTTVIFKSGDDLRQDMLALQVIKIINYIWRNEGLDLKMMPYTCLATGKHVGMIEVITKAKTVMNIQKQRGVMAALQVDSKQLNKWIKEQNSVDYNKAVDNFTRSCAGYCVATFILGIGDRNPDNIMIREDGQIFHIDFGHFLGHFKKKLGISRERVPFVLTSDFLRVIAKGAEYPQRSPEFDKYLYFFLLLI